MIDEDGWLTPFQDRNQTIPILQSQARKWVPEVAAKLPRRRTVIQAGGNVGIYPHHLLRYFDRVVTCEPHKPNYDCLKENLKDRSRLVIHNFALGFSVGTSSMTVDTENIGKHHISLDQSGVEVPMVTIDSLGEKNVDLIWLDIEGMEKKALEGAMETIRKYRPWIAFEENRKVVFHFNYDPIATSEWLPTIGYEEVRAMHRDFLFRPTDG